MSYRTVPWRLASVLAAGALAVAGCAGGEDPEPAALGAISGSCTDASNQPLASVEVSTEPATGFTVTDASGAYLLADVPAGTYTLKAARTGYVPFEQSVAVDKGATAYVDIRLARAVPLGSLAGRVAHADTGLAVVGATVTTDPATCEGVTGPDGGYRIDAVAAGTYTVAVAAAGYERVERAAVTVSGNQTTTVDFDLVAAVDIDTTCEQCHLDRDLLLADLVRDPPPDATNEGGSAGEG